MTDKELLKKNALFARKHADCLAPIMGGNIIASERAIGSGIIYLNRHDKKLKLKLRMLTSRGEPTLPIGTGWYTSGEAVLTTNLSNIMLVILSLGVEWIDFEQHYVPILGSRSVELREIVERLSNENITIQTQ